jgi:hypothetical protein
MLRQITNEMGQKRRKLVHLGDSSRANCIAQPTEMSRSQHPSRATQKSLDHQPKSLRLAMH